jgi:hypothetical protein
LNIAFFFSFFGGNFNKILYVLFPQNPWLNLYKQDS